MRAVLLSHTEHGISVDVEASRTSKRQLYFPIVHTPSNVSQHGRAGLDGGIVTFRGPVCYGNVAVRCHEPKYHIGMRLEKTDLNQSAAQNEGICQLYHCRIRREPDTGPPVGMTTTNVEMNVIGVRLVLPHNHIFTVRRCLQAKNQER